MESRHCFPSFNGKVSAIHCEFEGNAKAVLANLIAGFYFPAGRYVMKKPRANNPIPTALDHLRQANVQHLTAQTEWNSKFHTCLSLLNMQVLPIGARMGLT